MEPNKPNTTEPIYIPYCCHTSHEVVSILKSIYNEVDGDQFSFVCAVRKSEDPRLQMNHFAIKVLYELIKIIMED
jgi:hypothetical protein